MSGGGGEPAVRWNSSKETRVTRRNVSVNRWNALAAGVVLAGLPAAGGGWRGRGQATTAPVAAGSGGIGSS